MSATDPRPQQRFGCPACNSRLDYGVIRCGNCNEEAPVYNRPVFWYGLWASLAACAIAVLAALLT